MTSSNSSLARRVAVVVASVGLAGGIACHGAVTDALLTANNPGVISPGSTASPAGALALYAGALGRLNSVAGGSESSWMFGGLLADEYTTSSTFIQNDEADERSITQNNGTVLTEFRTLNQARTAVNQAIPAMKAFNPSMTAQIAELYFARAFAEMQLAMDFCNGIPLSDASSALVFGTPLTNDAVFKVAMATYDTAIATIGGASDAFSVSILNAAKIGKARALMGTGDYVGAAALVAGIPTTYSYDVTFSLPVGDNILWSQAASQRRYNIGDTSVNVNGTLYKVKPSIPFGSAKDPRLPVANSPAGTKSQDGSVLSFTTTLWAQSTSIPVVNGIDARLIEAENFLKKGDVTNYLVTMNALRTAGTLKLGTLTIPVMAALTDPGTTATRVDQLFYEKAFWTFSRGQRLSDMRRLIRQYGRDQSTVFPGTGGVNYRGVPYGPDVNLPVPFNEFVDPNFKGCIDRNA